jgi:RND family efflux transporter MFP subunit
VLIRFIPQNGNLLLILFVSFLFIGCTDNGKDDIAEVNNAKIVKVLHLFDSKEFKNTYEYPATIYPFQNTVLTFEVPGKITKFNYNVAQRVKKGKVIAKLDDTIYQANLNSAKATYEKAKLDYTRYNKLFLSKTISKSKIEEIQQHLNISKSNYDIAKKNFENTSLQAEFDGMIAKKYVEDYAQVVAKQKIVELQDNSKFKVKFFISENDIIKRDEKVNLADVINFASFYVLINNDEKLKYKAAFVEISTKAESVTGTYEATLSMENPKDINILSGMTAKVQVLLKTGQKENIFIPLKSVFTDNTKRSFVWLVDKNNKVHKKEIITKSLQSDSIEVIKGLNLDDTIVTSGVHFLKQNDTIQVYKKLGN